MKHHSPWLHTRFAIEQSGLPFLGLFVLDHDSGHDCGLRRSSHSLEVGRGCEFEAGWDQRRWSLREKVLDSRLALAVAGKRAGPGKSRLYM